MGACHFDHMYIGENPQKTSHFCTQFLFIKIIEVVCCIIIPPGKKTVKINFYLISRSFS